MYVLVRAFGDEPVRLSVVSDEGPRMVLAGISGATISLPREWFYLFDADRFTAMREAYDRKESESLKSLWKNSVHA